jgi:hypothetical protein
MIVTVILLVLALACFIIGAAGVALGRVNPVALGLAFWVSTHLLAALQGA